MHQVEEPFDTLNGIYAITRSQKGYTVDVEINGHKSKHAARHGCSSFNHP